MGLRKLQGVDVKVFDNVSGDVPEGFNTATFNNIGVTDAILTQNGKPWTLPKGQIYTFGYRMDNNAWLAVNCNAVGTKVECTYY